MLHGKEYEFAKSTGGMEKAIYPFNCDHCGGRIREGEQCYIVHGDVKFSGDAEGKAHKLFICTKCLKAAPWASVRKGKKGKVFHIKPFNASEGKAEDADEGRDMSGFNHSDEGKKHVSLEDCQREMLRKQGVPTGEKPADSDADTVQPVATEMSDEAAKVVLEAVGAEAKPKQKVGETETDQKIRDRQMARMEHIIEEMHRAANAMNRAAINQDAQAEKFARAARVLVGMAEGDRDKALEEAKNILGAAGELRESASTLKDTAENLQTQAGIFEDFEDEPEPAWKRGARAVFIGCLGIVCIMAIRKAAPGAALIFKSLGFGTEKIESTLVAGFAGLGLSVAVLFLAIECVHWAVDKVKGLGGSHGKREQK